MTPTAPGGKDPQVTKFAHCLRIIFVIGMYAYIFERGGGFSAGGIFHGDNFPWGGKFPGSEFFRRYFTLREFARIPIRNPSYVFLF